MPSGNTARSYGSIAKTFHWLTALLVLTIIPIGLIANGMAQDIRNPDIASTVTDFSRTFWLFSLHKTLGVVIFFVALARISWAISQPKPGLLNAGHRIESFLAETVHWLLYGSLVLVPLTGWIDHAATSGFAPIRWPFGQDLPFVPKDPGLASSFAGLHKVLERVLVIALILHIAGALKHHIVDRDATLRRMLPGRSNAPTPPAHRRHLLPPVAALTVWAIAIAIGGAIGTIAPLPRAPGEQTERTQATTGWQVDEGNLNFVITQMGNKVQGSFADWNANITFEEPVAPGPAGAVDVTIAIASLSLGSVTDQAMGPDFLDADFFPEAHFSGDIIRTASGYTAKGPLVIRDTSLVVTLPFDLSVDGDTARMTGTLSLNRLDFGVGASMADESALGFAVDISIDLTAIRN